MDNFRETYKEEAYELLAELETSLLELEKLPDDTELIGHVFRAMHTIKGSGAMFGFDNVADFTHEIETVFDLVRNGKIFISKPLTDLSLSACDLIRKMVDGESVDKDAEKEIIESFKKMLSGTEQHSEIPSVSGSAELSRKLETYRIQFQPDPGMFKTGSSPLLLLNELRELGKCQVVAYTDRIPLLKNLDPETCYLNWNVILTGSSNIDEIRDVFIFVEDNCVLSVELIDRKDDDASDDKEYHKKLGEILVERGDITKEELSNALKSQKRVGEILIETKTVKQEAVESALAEQEKLRKTKKRQQEAVISSSIRVAADKLDILVDLVGELVTVQARLRERASSQDDPVLLSISEDVERLTAELRDNTMSIRMLPIGATFNKFRRLVRDLSEELEKEVVMETSGEETELDKTVIEQLSDPLVHLIRNTIDHGIELPDVRASAGKPEQGIVRLSAQHSGSSVLIQISDDGAGIDTEAIRSAALEKGLITPDAELDEKEIFSFIFAPGFSTAKELSELSGRGVGLDVVKRRIESLRGSVEISSTKGVGTTFTLKMPLTLVITDGLLVRIGEGFFVAPLSAVEECVEISRNEAEKASERSMMKFREEIIPYLSLREMFNADGKKPLVEQIVIVEINNQRAGFGVDRVIGQHQTVIKTLGRFYDKVKGVSGATILGDGTVALILDLHQLFQSVERDF
ncbi:MAG: chemotaxis protein CheA [Desulfobacterales bacterium]|nr:chemotaxis protein CheA [Desulfobacterales bacterium]